MGVEGVMVTYNYAEAGEKSTIMTVAASGIRFSERWILTHGSILSPLKEVQNIKDWRGKLDKGFYDSLPEIYVTCEKGRSKIPSIHDDIEMLSRERNLNEFDIHHSSYQVKVLTGRICHIWQCQVLDRCVEEILYSWTIGHRDGGPEEQTHLGKTLLSVFVLIDLEIHNKSSKVLRPLSELFDIVKPSPGRGAIVDVYSTPFGCEAFLNSATRGTICGVVGNRPSLLLTDAATAMGSEGGPVFTVNTESGVNGALVGVVVCAVSWWRGEWVGVALVAPLYSTLAAKLRRQRPTRSLATRHTAAHVLLDVIDRTTVLVRCGSTWGSGLYVGAGLVLTCSHVVKNSSIYKVTVYCGGVKETAIVRYKTVDDKAYDLALIYTNPECWNHLIPVVFADKPAIKGEAVIAAGYPFFNENNVEDLKPTITSGHINNSSPSMIQTSCCIQSGFSGGGIFRVNEGGGVSMLGVVVSNARTPRATFPRNNMAVPVTAFAHVLRRYFTQPDVNKLIDLERTEEIIQSQWRLLPYKSKI